MSIEKTYCCPSRMNVKFVVRHAKMIARLFWPAAFQSLRFQ
ncbi:hypothetical protein BSU04_24750 [Caballeronia sordidicola]|uniref:Uncharacterized protein n=1 Tax=Caballeronia sordidicola TaxID=196367 RepID=A0A226WYU1_CABSO|nr:hypothetical protein BSU04_24750 [Caballeronia sordidicola]